MPPLTQKQREEYLAIGGVRCPYCGSHRISGGASSEPKACLACGKRWKDIFSLVGVEAVE